MRGDARQHETGICQALDDARAADGSRTGPRRFWSTRELAILREHYPRPGGGLQACLDQLPGRGARSIYNKAQALSLGVATSARTREGVPKQRWQTSPEIDRVIQTRWPGCTCATSAGAALVAPTRCALRGRSTADLDRGQVQRLGLVENFPSQAEHVWNLVAEALRVTGYGRKPSHPSRGEAPLKERA